MKIRSILFGLIIGIISLILKTSLKGGLYLNILEMLSQKSTVMASILSKEVLVNVFQTLDLRSNKETQA